MTVRLGALLGFGNVAANGHLPAWQRRGDARIVAIADIDADRRGLAGEALKGARLYADPLALLERERLQFVDIATPPAQHAALIARAAGAGCHVLCEKPLVTTPAELRQVMEAQRRANVAVVTVHNWKHSAQFVRVAALVADGVIGRLRHLRFEVERCGQAVSVGSAWRTQAAQAGGGILVDHGWHTFYLMLALVREYPRRIRARVERRRHDLGDVEDSASCVIEFETVTGEIDLTWNGSARRTRWLLQGDDGTVELSDDWLELRRGPRLERVVFPQSLSAGSHHPEWFDAVIETFFGEVDDRSRRGDNLREAELCLTLTTLAYAAAAEDRALPVPPIGAEANPALAHSG